MIPNIGQLTRENYRDIDLFPRNELNRIFKKSGVDNFVMNWEMDEAILDQRLGLPIYPHYANLKFLHLLGTINHLLTGIVIDVGCGRIPVTNYLVFRHDFEFDMGYEYFWKDYLHRFGKAYNKMTHHDERIRILIDYIYGVHESSSHYDEPLTAQVDLRTLGTGHIFRVNDEKRGYIVDCDKAEFDLVKQVSDFSYKTVLEEARLRVGSKKQKLTAVVDSKTCNYGPWKTKFSRFYQDMEKGGIFVVHNSDTGNDNEFDYANKPAGQEEIIAFFRDELSCDIVIDLIDKDNHEDLYLIAQKN